MVRNANAVPNGGRFPAWIEVQNLSTSVVSLRDWSLSNDDNPRKFVFAGTTTIAPSSYLVVWCDSDFAASGQHTGFVLTNETEHIFLYNAAGQRVDGVTLSRQLVNTSVSRVGEGWRLSVTHRRWEQ